MSRLRHVFTRGVVFAIAASVVATTAAAQVTLRSDRAVYFTFSQPVALPTVTLPPGKYLFRLADSQTTRSVVQVYSEDGMKLHGMMMTIPTQRQNVSDDAEVVFMESASGAAVPVRSYWYPGIQTGWEFVYPRAQATTLARTSGAPVLTTARDVAADEMQSAELVRVDASGNQVALDERAPAAPGISARGEVQSSAPAAANSAQPAPAVTPAPSGAAAPANRAAGPIQSEADAPAPREVARAEQGARTTLPQTAASTGNIAVAGVVSLLAALAVGMLRRRA